MGRGAKTRRGWRWGAVFGAAACAVMAGPSFATPEAAREASGLRLPAPWLEMAAASPADLSGQAAIDPERAVAVDATYAVRVFDPAGRLRSESRWTFRRRADQIVLNKGGLEERWVRDPNGAVSLQRWFQREGRVVDYASGELRTLGIEPDWSVLGRLVDPQGLTRSTTEGAPASTDGDAVGLIVLTGLRGGESWRLGWQPRVQLPTFVERRLSLIHI